MLAFCYASIAVLTWASIPYLVSKGDLSVAIGLGYSLVNLGQFLNPMVIGYTMDNYGWKCLTWLLIG